MEISSNSLNQPVNFYSKNTGNTINTAINDDNHLYASNIFASEISAKEQPKTQKKKRKSKRLNTMDSDYLPDEAQVSDVKKADNFFLETEKPNICVRFKKAMSYFFSVTPIINYFFLKEKTKKIQKTVETLNDINQNVDDLLNSAVPYGEETALYTDIAKNLTDAATILGKANKEF